MSAKKGIEAKIVIAKDCGFCFGVKRAVETIYELKNKTDKKIVVAGELIHNKNFIERLEKDGIYCIDEGEIAELEREKDNVIVVIRTHGATKELVGKIEKMGIEYVDATCPFVKRIHKIVDENSKNCDYTIIAGDKNHPEVKGIQSYSNSKTVVLSDEDECEKFVKSTPNCSQTAVLMVSQTTNNNEKYVNCQKIIKNLYTKVKIFDTICNVTGKRQNEAKKIASNADIMFIIGCVKSSNTKKLYDIASEYCKKTYLVEDASEIPESEIISELERAKEFYGSEKNDFTVGITAGASTPDDIIEEVVAGIGRIINSGESTN
ncbi:MAG: 4-hydroxy-3-methylbut-2-enyl diphosphate reductase [Clostridiales bacterium]|nr:4-hydroxy-3-methylbut-2-enyl diphosphate reductase [Clostridiales bacterium]